MSDERLIGNFTNQKILVVGDVILDEYLTGDCSRISPEAPVPIVAVTNSRIVLGGAANTAHNITALGGQAVLIGAIGKEGAGRQLEEKAAEAGIEFLAIRGDRPTVRKTRVVGQQQQLLRLDYESTAGPDATIHDRVLDRIATLLPSCASMVISDYAKGLLSRELCQRAIELAREAGKSVLIDPRPQHASFYPGCSYLTPNWKEAQGLLARPEQSAEPDYVQEVGRLLVERFGASILLTMGAKGMAFFDSSGQEGFSEPAVAREVFDVSGAGDTVVATFSLARAAGASTREAVALANRAAGIAVGKLGTATVSHAELLGVGTDDQRLIPRNGLRPLVDRLRRDGKRIATINGSFDLMHAGHLHILHEAKEQADVLIVGLNSDRSVRSYKGADRPFVGERDRAAMLLALRSVDYVHIFDEEVPMPFIQEVKPDVHVNGVEYGADCIEAPAVRAVGGRLHLVQRLPGLSTTGLLASIGARKA